MQEQPNKVESEDDRRAQRAVVLQLLCADRGECWSRRELESELATIELPVIEAAIKSLKEVGLVQIENSHVRATEAARRLESLGLVAV